MMAWSVVDHGPSPNAALLGPLGMSCGLRLPAYQRRYVLAIEPLNPRRVLHHFSDIVGEEIDKTVPAIRPLPGLER